MKLFAFLGNLLLAYPAVTVSLLLVLNLVSMIVYIADKQKAKKGAWRIPEATLLTLAWAFGSVGAMIGMYVFRHKTKHIRFCILVPLAFFVHAALIVLSVWAACHT